MKRYQEIVSIWLFKVFSFKVANDLQERSFRFFEEATELVQSTGITKEQCLEILEYVYSRPPGETGQETGGVMVTLTALCDVAGVDLEDAAYKEYRRINTAEVIKKIQVKQATKPHPESPLPGTIN